MRIKTKTIAGAYFKDSIVTLLNGKPLQSATTKRTSPKGGVIRPFINARIITRLKWTRSIPSAFTAGNRMGVNSSALEPVSRKQPIIIKINEQIKNMTWIFPADNVSRTLPITTCILSIDTIQVKKLATETSSMNIPHEATVSPNAFHNPFKVTFL